MENRLPESMRAIVIESFGDPDVLKLASVPTPQPDADQVLVRVQAAGVNRPDVLQRLGQYRPPPDASPLPGLEIAGEVVAAGRDAGQWRRGDRVMALTHGGGYAEYCAVNEGHCLPVPDSLSMTEAAAVPETFFTVWYNAFMRVALSAGETLLVHGGSSGIGSTAIQLGVQFGARVIVTAGTDEKCEFCRGLGASEAINYRSGDWAEAVRSIVGARGVDVILDMVAGDYARRNIDLLGRDGRYVIIATLGGALAELDLRPILLRRLTVTGSTLRPQSTAEKSLIASEIGARILPLLASRTVAPIIDSSFPLGEAAAAHRLMESSAHMGKIVLTT